MALSTTSRSKVGSTDSYFKPVDNKPYPKSILSSERALTTLARKLKLDGEERESLLNQVGKNNLTFVRHHKDESYYRTYSPTVKCMKLFAHYYKEKYGLPIYIFNTAHAIKFIFARLKSKDKSPFAIIEAPHSASHVVPIYGHFSKKDNKLYLLVMDSLIQNEFPTDLPFNLASLKVKNLVVLFSRGRRQTSPTGCKIDALITLKSTHFVTTHEHIEHMPDFIGELTMMEISDMNSTYTAQFFNVPTCFAVGAERLDDLANFDNVVVDKKGRTAAEKRALYHRTVTLNESVTSGSTILIQRNREAIFLNYLRVKENKMRAKLPELVEWKIEYSKTKNLKCKVRRGDEDPDLQNLKATTKSARH